MMLYIQCDSYNVNTVYNVPDNEYGQSRIQATGGGDYEVAIVVAVVLLVWHLEAVLILECGLLSLKKQLTGRWNIYTGINVCFGE